MKTPGPEKNARNKAKAAQHAPQKQKKEQNKEQQCAEKKREENKEEKGPFAQKQKGKKKKKRKMSALEAVRRHQVRALQREAASKQRTDRAWIGGVAAVGTVATIAAATALALARRRKKRGAAGGADIPSDPSGASGASESETADESGRVGRAEAALAALHTARDAMSEAKRGMIEASGACLPALIAYAERLGEHNAYNEAHQEHPSLSDAVKEAKAELEHATAVYNALVDLELAARNAYTESVREYSIALAHYRTLVPRRAHTDSENAETHETSGQEGGALEEHTGDAGGETDVQLEERTVRAKERAMRKAHKKCVDATVNTAKLRGERQALGGKPGGGYLAKRGELDEAKKEQEIAEKGLEEASDVAYAGAVKETKIQRLQRDAQAPQSKIAVPGLAPFLAGAANAVTSLWSLKTIEGPPVSDSSGWGRARPARERRPCRATRRFL